MKEKELFIDIFKTNIKREGSERLLDYLIKSDFFTTPASAKFHCAFEGGLCLHSINVYNRLLKLIQNEYGDDWEKKYSRETVAICGLLHDVCKVNYYAVEERNVKIDGSWVSRPYYTIKEELPYGHSEKSVYIVNGFIRLRREEALAINWHMGGFDDRVKGGSYSLSAAFQKEPLCVFMHTADLVATYVDENRDL